MYLFIYLYSKIFLDVPRYSSLFLFKHVRIALQHPALARPKVPGLQQDGFAASSLGPSGSPCCRYRWKGGVIPTDVKPHQISSNHNIDVSSIVHRPV